MQEETSVAAAADAAPRLPAIKTFLKAYFLNFPDWQAEDLANLRRYAHEGPGFPYRQKPGGYTYRDAQEELDRCSQAVRWHAIQVALDTGGKKKAKALPPRDAAAAFAAFEHLVRRDKLLTLEVPCCFSELGAPDFNRKYAASVDSDASKAEYRIVWQMLLQGYATNDVEAALLAHGPFLAARKGADTASYAAATVAAARDSEDLRASRAKEATAGEGVDAYRASLNGDWRRAWRQSVAYEYWSCRMAEHGQLDLFLDNTCCCIANCVALGWTDWAIQLARAVRQRLATGALHDFDAGKRPFNQRRTQYLVLRLVESWQGWPPAQYPVQAFDEPLFEQLLAAWRDPDPQVVAPLLLAACDRHVLQSKPGSSSKVPDLDYRRFWFDPFEIHLVLSLRRLCGLDNPVLPHALMETPLGALPERAPHDSDALLVGVLQQARHDHTGL